MRSCPNAPGKWRTKIPADFSCSLWRRHRRGYVGENWFGIGGLQLRRKRSPQRFPLPARLPSYPEPKLIF